jgi:anaerobic ribonucleoside-triphosphate reductase activating protein
MVFTGYELAEARSLPDPAVGDLLGLTDLLIDGPYIRELPERSRRWIGSSNQRVHVLSHRYRVDDPRWNERNTVELRIVGGELIVNGFPTIGLHRVSPTKVH